MSRLCDCGHCQPEEIQVEDIQAWAEAAPMPRAIRDKLMELRFCAQCGDLVPDGRERIQNELIQKIASGAMWVTDRSAPESPDPRSTTDEGLLPPTKLGPALGVSAQWVRDHWDQLGGKRTGAPGYYRYWFDLERARERFFAIGSNGSEPASEPASNAHRRRRRSNGTAPLLPVKGRS